VVAGSGLGRELMLAAAPSPGGFQALPDERCRELLAARHQGRVAWETSGGPQLLPISYALHHGEIAFRTSPYGALAQLRDPTMVAFEIDDIQPDTGVGWSVVVRGWAQPVPDSLDVSTLWTDPTTAPRVTGTRDLFVVIHERSISGRTVRAPDAG
jgi:uncharacterized protein